jgi:hypothetical protein
LHAAIFGALWLNGDRSERQRGAAEKKPRAEWTDTGHQRARAGGHEIARQRQCRIVPSTPAFTLS